MSDEQAARKRLVIWCQPGMPKAIHKALNDYRDAIVAATVAEYEAKLAARTPESAAGTAEPGAKSVWPQCNFLSNTGVMHPAWKDEPGCNGNRCECCASPPSVGDTP